MLPRPKAIRRKANDDQQYPDMPFSKAGTRFPGKLTRELWFNGQPEHTGMDASELQP